MKKLFFLIFFFSFFTAFREANTILLLFVLNLYASIIFVPCEYNLEFIIFVIFDKHFFLVKIVKITFSNNLKVKAFKKN